MSDSKLHTRFAVSVELLSPLHIGTGTELLLDYDLVPHDGHTYRVNEEALLAQALAKAEAQGATAMNRLLAGRPAAELLTEADFADPHSPLFRYVLPGTPFTTTPGAKVWEQIKDVHDRLYLPGSSLKGALRTVLAWGIYTTQQRQPDLSRLGRSRSWASQELERDLFGRDPNHDWLRALQVEDSQPLAANSHPATESGQALALRTVQVYPTATDRSPGLNVDVEAVETGATFHLAVTVDEYGFQPEVARQLGWQGKRGWLQRLVALGQSHAAARLAQEVAYYQDNGPPSALALCTRWLKELRETLAPNEFLVQIGWGAGWESKTLGSDLLRQDDRAFERLLSQYRLTKEQDRRLGDPFPKSRHLVLRDDRPTEPLGWVRIRLEGWEAMAAAPLEAVEAKPVAKPAPPPPPAGRQTGRVARFFEQRGFGFIRPDGGGPEVFVHVNDVTNARLLQEGQRVAYDVVMGDKGPRAIKVLVLAG